MRIGELLASTVVDRHGTPVGGVEDVRLVQDGPYVEGFGAALRVDGLVVGGGGLSARLGYHRHGVRGPALLRWIFSRIERKATYVPWRDVEGCEDRTITLRVRADDLTPLADAL